ncbi:hypothetical protein T4C_13664 [Trichinella pseudospiralis]|uniref:Uncharacterized protein n=1 Tax=Trichinella pseudospiralis TaxID=6337 RepID=A0A0V1JKR1_TRIPS|nr:hypothetical protein T4C_13664 [Trichinella pseudospiralis]
MHMIVSIFETAAQSLFYVAYGEEKRIGLESYDLPKSLVDPAKTEEEIENSLATSLEEANEEKMLNKDLQKYEKNESNILKKGADPSMKAVQWSRRPEESILRYKLQ